MGFLGTAFWTEAWRGMLGANMKVASLVMALFALAAGCIEQATDSSGRPARTTAEWTATEPPVDTPSVASVGPLRMDGCVGAGSAISYPREEGPGQPPNGWPTGSGLANSIYLDFYECERLGFGGYERPNVRMILEYHDKMLAPEACTGDLPPATGTVALVHMWLNDEELAAALRREGGYPAEAASIEVLHEATMGTHATHWTWTIGGASENRLTFRHAAIQEGIVFVRDAYFWEVNGTIHRLLLDHRIVEDHGDGRLAIGEVHPPNLSASEGRPYVGRAAVLLEMTIASELVRYGDASCASKL